jgi:hypothetical protein
MFYLQKTCFRIKDKKVEQEDDIYFEPLCFLDAFQYLEDGQVYRVLGKNLEGEFYPLSNNCNLAFADKVSNQIHGEQLQN